MKRIYSGIVLTSLILLLANLSSQAQQSVATNPNTNAVVPHLVSFHGVLTDANGKPLTGITGVTFYLYQDQQGGAPLWMETQNVQPDSTGHFSVMLGAASSTGLPSDIFTNGAAHWLGVQAQGQPEQSRVMLLSVPYALKAADAQTIGGLPPSAFVLATAPTSSGAISMQQSATTSTTVATSGLTTSGGTVNKLAKFNSATNVTNSQLFDNGTNVGIGNMSPGAKLDVSGSGIFRGALQLPSTAAASSTTKGFNSQPFDFFTSVFNGTSGVNQHFRWQAEPVNAGLSTASGKLNLLFASGTGTPAETGLSINKSGIITFAKGQTFPISGNETVTGNISASQLISTVANGTAPLKVTSMTQVPNLNASMLGGLTANNFVQLGASNYSLYNPTSISSVQAANSGSGGSYTMTGVLNVMNELTPGSSGFGLVAENWGTSGSGILGSRINLSNIASGWLSNLNLNSFGIWADNNSTDGNLLIRAALGATADDANAIYAVNNSPTLPTIHVQSGGSGGGIAIAGNGTPLTWANFSSLSSDQDGSIELGANNSNPTELGKTPYIDFHYGVDGTTIQNYNVRVVNDSDAQLTIKGSSQFGHATTLNVQGVVSASQGFSGQCLNSGYFAYTYTTGSCNMDLAEAYATSEPTEPGDLVSLVPSAEATVKKASRQYDSMLLGVVSSNPGLVFDNGKTHLAGDNTRWLTKDKAIIALAGRVPVKVSVENGPIAVGDPLTSSSHPGVAMKATAAAKIIGYALEPARSDGKVLTFIEPGYYAAPEVARLRSTLAQVQRENAVLRNELTQVLRQVREIRAKVEVRQSHTAKVSAMQN